jgi:hypothetical protein
MIDAESSSTDYRKAVAGERPLVAACCPTATKPIVTLPTLGGLPSRCSSAEKRSLGPSWDLRRKPQVVDAEGYIRQPKHDEECLVRLSQSQPGNQRNAQPNADSSGNQSQRSRERPTKYIRKFRSPGRCEEKHRLRNLAREPDQCRCSGKARLKLSDQPEGQRRTDRSASHRAQPSQRADPVDVKFDQSAPRSNRNRSQPTRERTFATGSSWPASDVCTCASYESTSKPFQPLSRFSPIRGSSLRVLTAPRNHTNATTTRQSAPTAM